MPAMPTATSGRGADTAQGGPASRHVAFGGSSTSRSTCSPSVGSRRPPSTTCGRGRDLGRRTGAAGSGSAGAGTTGGSGSGGTVTGTAVGTGGRAGSIGVGMTGGSGSGGTVTGAAATGSGTGGVTTGAGGTGGSGTGVCATASIPATSGARSRRSGPWTRRGRLPRTRSSPRRATGAPYPTPHESLPESTDRTPEMMRPGPTRCQGEGSNGNHGRAAGSTRVIASAPVPPTRGHTDGVPDRGWLPARRAVHRSGSTLPRSFAVPWWGSGRPTESADRDVTPCAVRRLFGNATWASACQLFHRRVVGHRTEWTGRGARTPR